LSLSSNDTVHSVEYRAQLFISILNRVDIYGRNEYIFIYGNFTVMASSNGQATNKSDVHPMIQIRYLFLETHNWTFLNMHVQLEKLTMYSICIFPLNNYFYLLYHLVYVLDYINIFKYNICLICSSPYLQV
jgi:hypothetical protein